jgi:hypothetical protein
MDKFRVGQKVRVKRCNNQELAQHAGKITTITNKDSDPEYWELDLPTPPGEVWVYHSDDIDPVYDGDGKSSWEECEWKPDSHRVQIKIGEVTVEGKGYTGESFHTQ